MVITSTSNPKVKRLVNLKKKKKLRDEEQVFLAEGLRMFREVPRERTREVYVSESFSQKERALLGKFQAGNVEVLSDAVFDYVSDTRAPQGILCVVARTEYTLAEILKPEPVHIIVLDHLQDPGNLGTIVRTAEGAGVTGIVMSEDCVDLYNPKTIRATMGSVYRMPLCHVSSAAKAATEMKERGIRVYAAHLDGELAYDEADYRKGCAFLIGNEGNGLRDTVAAQADQCIRIPMAGQVESLNAAIAASVLMFEVSRQRRRKE